MRSLRKAREIVERVESRRAPQWQPIETAPKDGTPVLLCCMKPSKYSRHEPGFMAVCGYDEGWGAFNRFHFPPTHWQPLPPEPEVPDGSR
ncbi:DUF551 domain-containing protein [Stenotrophomonas maltophilia]